ncbi:hypothetical protein [Thioalkalivibrio sp. ALJ24]|uniref:hypothetical protein n=1 Tax=Thioalkalivibrio sp. ALJ24 TaxID=545276 RepID=UPI0012E9D624|nr:hypothetical protein [Thioalkalivibrio sp. ALJ24]
MTHAQTPPATDTNPKPNRNHAASSEDPTQPHTHQPNTAQSARRRGTQTQQKSKVAPKRRLNSKGPYRSATRHNLKATEDSGPDNDDARTQTDKSVLQQIKDQTPGTDLNKKQPTAKDTRPRAFKEATVPMEVHLKQRADR